MKRGVVDENCRKKVNVKFGAGDVGFTAQDHDLSFFEIQVKSVFDCPISYCLGITLNERNAMKDVGWKTMMVDLIVISVNYVVGKYRFGG